MTTTIKKMPKITDKEFMEISAAFEERHAVYNRLWNFGRPRFTDAISTAAICWNKEFQHPTFLFNPDFWTKLTLKERIVVIAHEMLHVIFNHGARFAKVKKGLEKQVNTAADIVVNHSLVNNFEFKRSDFPSPDSLCWVDTIFPGEKLPDDKHVEFYLARMKQDAQGGKGGDGEPGDKGDGQGGPGTLDEHNPDLTPEEVDAIIGRLDEELTPEEKEEIQKVIEEHYEGAGDADGGDGQGGQKAGKSGTGKWTFVEVKKYKFKRKWETVVKKWAKMKLLPEMKGIERWGRKHRRLSAIDFGDLKLPCEMDVDAFRPEPCQLKVLFFLDVSGSCAGMAERFWKAANTLPPDRFDVRLFWFNTITGEVDKKNPKIKISGGTSFSCIETAVQNIVVNEKIDYPDAVWVMTDGYGDNVAMEHPDRWYWFLSVKALSFIPKECNIFMLEDYE